MSLPFILTTAGRNAIVNAQNTGTSPVVIASVGVGTSSWSPTIAATSLNSEVKKITAIGGGATADDIIHVTAEDSSSDSYTCREVGLFLADNTLLAIYSQALPIVQKEAASSTFIAVDLAITGLPAGSITVGPTNFNIPAATETVAGAVQLATGAEVNDGTESGKAITPSALLSRIATSSQIGLVQLATPAESVAGLDDAKAVTPAALASALPSEATFTQDGLLRIATQAEVNQGIIPVPFNAAVVPETLRFSTNVCKAWVNFNGTGTPAARANGSYNVSSITDNGVGEYTINFTAAMANTDYAAVGFAREMSATIGRCFITAAISATKTTGSMRFRCWSIEGTTWSLRDSEEINIIFFAKS
jgi:hypothetical protein